MLNGEMQINHTDEMDIELHCACKEMAAITSKLMNTNGLSLKIANISDSKKTKIANIEQ